MLKTIPLLVAHYPVPLKAEHKLYALNWPTILNRTSQEMREQFEKNGKDIDSDKVQSIIDNTVIFFEEMQTKYREIIDYYVVNAKHRLKGVKAFGDICRELGYIDGSYEGDWSDELKEQVFNKAI